MFNFSSARRTTLAVATLAIVAAIQTASADTAISWNNTTSLGNWGTASNWNPNAVPDGDYSVIIPTGSGIVNLDINPTINAVTTESSTKVDFQADKTLTTIQLNNQGAMDFSDGGNLNVTGSASNSGDLSFYNSNVVQFNNLNNTFNLVQLNGGGWQSALHSEMTVSGTLTNDGDGFILNMGNLLNAGTLINSNYLFLMDNGAVVIDHLINNRIMFLENNCVATINQLENHGAIQLHASKLNLINGGNGITTVSASEYIEVDGASEFNVVNSGITTNAFNYLANVAGELDLSGNHTYNWNTIDITGTLRTSGNIANINTLNNHGTLSINSGEVNLLSGSPGLTTIPSDATYTIYGSLNVVNNGVKTNAITNLSQIDGNLNLYDSKSYVWPNLVVNGQLQLASDIQTDSLTLSSKLAVYSSGKFKLGNGTLAANKIFQIFSDGILHEVISSSNHYGNFEINGALLLGGTIEISLANGFIPQQGDQFTIIKAANGLLNGQFNSIIGNPYPGGTWEITYDDAHGLVILTAFGIPEPASFALLSIGSFGLLRRTCRKRRS